MKSLSKYARRHGEILTISMLLVVFAIVPLILGKVATNFFTLMLLYFILVQSLNVINGYSGQFNVGQAGFYCVGAYTCAILTTNLGLSFWLVLPFSGLFTALISLLLSLPTVKLKGMYFTIVTLGFSEIIRQVALNWNSLTRGPRGISNIPAPSFFGISSSRSHFFFYLIWMIVVIMLFCTKRLLASRIGRSWLAIREDEQAAASLGIEVVYYKVLNIAYSAFWAGIAGCVYASFQRFVSPESFSLDESFNILAMNVLGGQGTLLGPLVGSLMVNGITEIFRSALQYRMLIYSILIIGMMWLRPQGLIGSGVLGRGQWRSGSEKQKSIFARPTKEEKTS